MFLDFSLPQPQPALSHLSQATPFSYKHRGHDLSIRSSTRRVFTSYISQAGKPPSHQAMTSPLLLRRTARRLLPKRPRPCSTFTTSPKTDDDTSTPSPPPPATPAPDLYATHVPTTPFQKLFIAGYSAATALRDPERGDMVAALGETTGLIALRKLRETMAADPVGRELLEAKPDIKEESVHPDRLRELAPGTFGREYARFMDHHGYSPDGRTAVRFVDDPELAFVIQRYRQVHDFWHVLCGLPPTVLGELALKWFEMVQTRLPIAALSGLVGPLSLPAAERKVLREQYIPWAVRTAGAAKPFMCVWYERSFEEPLDAMRARLHVTPAPPLVWPTKK